MQRFVGRQEVGGKACQIHMWQLLSQCLVGAYAACSASAQPSRPDCQLPTFLSCLSLPAWNLVRKCEKLLVQGQYQEVTLGMSELPDAALYTGSYHLDRRILLLLTLVPGRLLILLYTSWCLQD